MRKFFYTISLSIIFALTANAQEATTGQEQKDGEKLQAKEIIRTEPVMKSSDNEYQVYDVVEQMPSFPGGVGALMQYLSSHMKYPVFAEENGIQGRVICTFVIDRDGSVTDVKLAKSVDPSLDNEAVRVVKLMPKWIPGKQLGQTVRVKYTLPLTFRLPDPKPADKTQQNNNQ